MTRIELTVFAGLVAIGALLAGSHPVLADCDGPFPAFRQLVKSAKTIVIGDVVAVSRGGAWDAVDGGVSSRFTLKIAFLLRGSSDATIEVDDLPTTQCASVVGARLGDRIALAVDGSAFDRPSGVNMVAWIDAVPPPGFGPGSISQADTFSVNEVFALIGQEMPSPRDPESPPVGAEPSQSLILPGLLAATLVGAIAFAALVRRRVHAGDIAGR